MGTFSHRFLATAVAVACWAGAAHAQVTVPQGGTTSVPAGGSMNLGCNGLIVQGTFNVGDGQAGNTGNVNITSISVAHPLPGIGKITCAAGSQVEFHRNGYLSFCDPAGAAGTYVTRGRRSSSCRTAAARPSSTRH